MAQAANQIAVYLEIGKQHTFAGALAWPGWCRRGSDEGSALQALVGHAPRYARVLQGTTLGFVPPEGVGDLKVAERLEGNEATDFGAANVAPAYDAQPFDAEELARSEIVLRAVWRALDGVIEAGQGQELRKGPRGGGRDLGKIVEHVLGADGGYLGRLAWKLPKEGSPDQGAELGRVRRAMLAALAAGARGEIPEHGPRGGKLWTPRYFVRRVAWHMLDHAWEIEDRIVG